MQLPQSAVISQVQQGRQKIPILAVETSPHLCNEVPPCVLNYNVRTTAILKSN